MCSCRTETSHLSFKFEESLLKIGFEFPTNWLNHIHVAQCVPWRLHSNWEYQCSVKVFHWSDWNALLPKMELIAKINSSLRPRFQINVPNNFGEVHSKHPRKENRCDSHTRDKKGRKKQHLVWKHKSANDRDENRVRTCLLIISHPRRVFLKPPPSQKIRTAILIFRQHVITLRPRLIRLRLPA